MVWVGDASARADLLSLEADTSRYHEATLRCTGAGPTFLFSLLSPSPLLAQGRWDLGLLSPAVHHLSTTSRLVPPMPSPTVCLLGCDASKLP